MSPYDERRRLPRSIVHVEMCLRGNVSLLESRSESESELILFGRILNISEHGVAFVLPAFPLAEDFLTDDKPRTLSITIFLPEGATELVINAVHYWKLEECDATRGCVIGGEICEVRDEDRDRVSRYLDGLTQRS